MESECEATWLPRSWLLVTAFAHLLKVTELGSRVGGAGEGVQTAALWSVMPWWLVCLTGLTCGPVAQ